MVLASPTHTTKRVSDAQPPEDWPHFKNTVEVCADGHLLVQLWRLRQARFGTHVVDPAPHTDVWWYMCVYVCVCVRAYVCACV